MKIRCGIGLVLTLISTLAVAGEHMYMFRYSNFYNQLQHNSSRKQPDVRVGLFFVTRTGNAPCHIAQAHLDNHNYQEKLDVYASGEVTLPIHDDLKQSNPMLYIKSISEQPCKILVRVVAREPLQGKVNFTHIYNLTQQMQELLTELGDSVSNWFNPDVTGIKMEFSGYEQGILTTTLGKEIRVENHQTTIIISDFESTDSINLPEVTQNITPVIIATAK